MSRSTVPGLEKDVVALLRARGFMPLKTRKDGSITIMKLGRKFVHSRANGVSMLLTAPHVGVDAYCDDDIGLCAALDEVREKEDMLVDKVRALADEVLAYFGEKGVSLLMNQPKCGIFEFVTRASSSATLFKLVGTLDRRRSENVEIEVKGKDNTTGPVHTLAEVLEVFKEWAGYIDPTGQECHFGHTITLLTLDYHIHAMLFRGLKNISMIQYTVRMMSDDEPHLQNLLDRHRNLYARDEPHIAYRLDWVLNQQECEEKEGLHA